MVTCFCNGTVKVKGLCSWATVTYSMGNSLLAFLGISCCEDDMGVLFRQGEAYRKAEARVSTGNQCCLS